MQAAAALQPMLREYREQLEAEQRLPAPLVEKLREAGCYRMVIPRSLGGLQVDPITYTRVVELLAEGCGSVGWNLANNSIGQLVTLGLPDEGVEEIYGQRATRSWPAPRCRAAGRRCRSMAAIASPGAGASAAASRKASWMLASFQILDDGKPRTSPEGRPLYWRGVFKRDEAEIVPGSWDVSGLRGTGSFDWTVHDVFLPERRTMVHAGVPLDNQWERWPGVTYKLPAPCWVGPHHSSVITGIARAGINALIDLAGGKTPRGRTGLLCDNPQVQDAVGRADAILNAGRCYRSATIAELWKSVAAGEGTTLEQRARCRLASTYAADSARQAMDLMYRHGGSTSFKRDSRLAECWRDLQVVGQTVTIAPEWYPIGGRVLLGIDPGSRLR